METAASSLSISMTAQNMEQHPADFRAALVRRPMKSRVARVVDGRSIGASDDDEVRREVWVAVL